MRGLFVALGLVALCAFPACSCDNSNRHGDGGVGDMGVPVGGIYIMPSDVTLDLVTGQAPPTQAFSVFVHNDNGNDTDVTAMSTFTLADPTFGTMQANTFIAGTDHGGTTTLVANYNGATAQATIHVKVHGTFTSPDCPSCTFPGAGAASCGGMDTDPTVIYPNDGVLLPPNMNTISLQWLPGNGNTTFEIDLQNPATDVKIYANCKPTVDTRGAMSGGCQLDLSGAMWDFVAKSNKGGDPVKITVQGSSNGMCASPGANSVGMSFAEQDVAGGIYYWKSTVSASGTGGQIWRKEFGSTMPEEQITGVNNLGGTCNGCHGLSRDGLRMTINSDDDDSDDEYSDTNSGLVDVAMKTVIGGGGFGASGTPGFQTFNHDHSLFLASAGDGTGTDQTGGPMVTPNQFFIFDGNTFMRATPNAVTAAPAGQRATHPDWSADDKNVVFVVPTSVASWSNAFGQMLADDTHVLGGSLWTMPYTGSGAFGPATEILHAPSDLINNYYPSYAPDGSFIVFNHVDVTPGEFSGAPGLPDKDSFSNPHARVFVLQPGSNMPIDCANLNSTGDLSNSWPRWSPFIQTYKGQKLLWVTFSSTRDYGLLVRNSTGGNIQCYPPDSAEAPGGQHGTPFPSNCKQPQIWMAAINLTTAEVMNQGSDPSSPAFWLPFQDITTHNHTAQWTSSVVNMPPPDGGTCIAGGQNCTMAPNSCCADAPVCTANGTCGLP
jgi:hypothetical protein